MAISRFSNSRFTQALPKYTQFWDQSTTIGPPVSGYKLWLDGKDSSVFSFSSGSVVSEWRDKSGNGYNFSNATVSYQPTRQSGGLVDFDGTDDHLVSSSRFLNNMHNGGSNTFFMVWQADATGNYFVFDTGIGGSALVGWGIYDQGATNFRTLVTNGNSGTTTINTSGDSRAANGTVGLSTLRIDADNGTAANRAYIYLNSGSAGQTNSRTDNASSASSTYLVYMGGEGGSPAASGLNLNGKIGEVIWYDSDLSTANRESVRDWLIAKWGI